MILNLSYDHNFVELINRIRNKYSEDILSVEGISEDQLDVAKFSKKFMTSDNTSNASIDANGNVDGINMATYTKEVGKPIAKFNGYFLMWKELKEVYGLDVANEAVESSISGDVYVHDSTNFSLPYCFNYTAYDVVLKGLPSWTGIGKKTAPKTLLAYTEQIKNLLISVGSMQLGATGIADFLIFFSWFVERNLKGIHTEGGLNKADFEGREELWEQRVWEDSKQILTTWIYNINDNYRGDQTLFTNISLYDKYFLENLLGEINMHTAPYKIDADVVMQVQKMFVETMNEELKRTPLTYPVTTATFTRYDEEEITVTYESEDGIEQTSGLYNQFDKVDKKVGFRVEQTLVTDIEIGDVVEGRKVESIDRVITEKNKLRDTEFVKYIAKENLPYQFINMFNGESSVLSSCCRLRSDMNAFEKETFGSIGGSGSAKIGSIGVVTINLPRVAFRYKAGEIDSIEEEIKRLTHMTVRINFARRMLIKDKIERNMMPVYSDGFMILNRQFSTTGILGGYEFSKILGIDIKTDEGMQAQIDLLKVIRKTQDEIHLDPMYKEVPFNVEQVPAETTSSKLALKDEMLGINNIGLKLYSNQFIPLQETANLLDRIRIAGTMDSSDMLNGGSILHLNADQRIESVERMEELIYTVAKFGVMYWAINFDLLYCESCHTFEIKENQSGVCKHCGSTDTSSYIRVVGFLTKVKSWSDVKQNEDYAKRQMYSNI